MAPGDHNTIVYATSNVFKTTTAQTDFNIRKLDTNRLLRNNRPHMEFQQLVSAGTNINKIYIGTDNGRILVNTNNGTSWTYCFRV